MFTELKKLVNKDNQCNNQLQYVTVQLAHQLKCGLWRENQHHLGLKEV